MERRAVEVERRVLRIGCNIRHAIRGVQWEGCFKSDERRTPVDHRQGRDDAPHPLREVELTFATDLHILPEVFRCASILLLLTFTATGTGTLHFLHHLEHHDHAQPVGNGHRMSAGDCDDDGHDESTCAVCSVLHMAVTSDNSPTSLVSLGLTVAFLSQIEPRLDAQRVPSSFDCRGPPA